jgi:hypothetical protein
LRLRENGGAAHGCQGDTQKKFFRVLIPYVLKLWSFGVFLSVFSQVFRDAEVPRPNSTAS